MIFYFQLVSLQAELARKKEEAVNVTKNVPQSSSKLQIKPHIQQEIHLKKDVRKEVQEDGESENIPQSSSAIEDKVKESLLIKTKLYEQLRNKELVCEDDDRFLVNFNGESDEVPKEESGDDSDPESEWVTFVDALGRSRTCLRTDLDHYKKLDSKLKVEEHCEEPPQPPEKLVAPVSDEIMLWDKRKDELRKKWEEEENRLSKKHNIHYQDILFNEARTHGVGYYSFSQDESERTVQQEALKKLREETEKNQKVALSVKERRDQLMKQRVAAAKRRKRLRMGLPPDEDEKDEAVIPDDEDPNPKEKLKSKQNEPLEQKVDEFLNVMKRSAHVRPWDVGKDGIQAPVLTQHEWNDKQRAKRLTEFAPPSIYKSTGPINESHSSRAPSGKHTFQQSSADFEKTTPINFEYDVNEDRFAKAKHSIKRAEIPPPLSYDKGKEKKPKKCNIEESIVAGLNFLKNLEPKKSKTLDDKIREDYT
ncbi:hypothetical protein V9T40_007240 [Parthenolecanium corni]|uniref:CCDC174 alpha/beta GRSR domain-containing protein n=1 Tax=Parthenolecanium corni TaxID=536013 RepID=A0AAN9TX38_9HEMI